MNEDRPIAALEGLTEITIFPDGRLHVQGLGREIAALLKDLSPEDEILGQVLRQVNGDSDGEHNRCARQSQGP